MSEVDVDGSMQFFSADSHSASSYLIYHIIYIFAQK